MDKKRAVGLIHLLWGSVGVLEQSFDPVVLTILTFPGHCKALPGES